MSQPEIPVDNTNLQFNKETSEAAINIEHEVIPEQDEHDEEERKTQTDLNRETAQAPMGTAGTNHSGPT